jgi:type II secretory pathway pseudopilin PulG
MSRRLASYSRRARSIATDAVDSDGFALLEVLVAFVILALGLAAISSGVAAAMRSDGRANASRNTLRVAQSRLEAAGITTNLVPGTREGRTDNGFLWRETVTTMRIQGTPSDAGQVSSPRSPAATALTPYWVEITVKSADGTVAQLSALKLGAGGGP